ncbi:Superfamily II DNA and RNA helicase [Peptoclostridium litorale DSM 5388]|uniref:DEAD-box ATP-dependent RNA helicase CshA family protein n=1 Tax=Peptoclostridium litorale DSM 5388 TaxID=1121324 RepID=A0A069RQI2_PEPLI|nr:DEAD/DEAH box helicase [Peptoclostridium litorale]KDR96432.1 DEAD-box ATP-dependent RNA helicase CshA family protein [Peptoclostridium litorale DSM 5388]SIN70658.1 Superfamily II DNA and RNA helicase [Peptoclostridium litorale DSM 5388]
MKNFKDLNISDKLVEGLQREGITNPTKIQNETITLAIENMDIIAQAVTGSGKTLSYILPSFEKIDANSKDLHTIVLAPTHELVVQINNVVKNLAKNSNHPVRSTTIIGDVNIKKQIENLKSKPHIIVGTPGRMLELIKSKKIKAHQVKTIVIDEADKLLSDNNIQTVKDVIKTTLRDRQILVFSASIDKIAVDRASELMKNPKLINLADEKVNSDIEHMCVISSQRDKINSLRSLIHAAKPKKTIVFINKNELIQEVVSRLNYHQLSTVGIFGNATKTDRKKALDSFKSGKSNVLVASDLVARGLDLNDITHVINLDVPENLNEYIHRVGRTGRANKKGTAISIVTENEIPFLMKIEKLNGIVFAPKEIYNGKLMDLK